MSCAAAIWIPVPVLVCKAPDARRFARAGSRFGLAGSVETMAATIQTIEGWRPGTISYTNNNPGNLVYAGQPGATLGPGGFAVFSSYADGENALIRQLNLDASRGLTISQEMAKWAPAGQGSNDPVAYAAQVAAAEGVSVDTPLTAAFASGPGVSVGLPPALDAGSTDAGAPVDLASLVSDVGSVDPVWLAAGGVALALLVYAVVA